MATSKSIAIGRLETASLRHQVLAPAAVRRTRAIIEQHLGGGRATRGGSATGGGRGADRGQGAGRGRGRPTGDCGQAAPTVRQASFSGAFSDDPITAIIGGGLSGLACARELAQRGLRSVVFDTGEHGVGGRLATRTAADGSLKGAPPGLVFDHAAQYFTASDPAFQAMVQQWERDGAVRRWEGPVVGTLRHGIFAPDDAGSSGAVRYVGSGGMRRLAQYLASQAGPAGLVEVRRPQWVSGARATPEGWQLRGKGGQEGLFDAVIIAHNGKCANRLTAPMGVPQLHSQLRRLKLSANWVLMVAFRSPVPVPGSMEGAFVVGCPVLSWAASQTAKLLSPAGGSGSSGAECWTLISTQAYGRANKVPQENVPPEVAERVTREMLAAFELSLGLPPGSLPPATFTQTQLWGAALPLNSPRVPCIWDPVGRVGVCGDWVAGGGSMQAAVLSGRAMAVRIDASRGRGPTDIADLAQGLTTPLKAVQAAQDIGQFPAEGGVGAGADAAMSQPPPQPERAHMQEQAQRQPAKQLQQQQRRRQAHHPAAAAAAAAVRAPPDALPEVLARPVCPTNPA